MIGEHMHNHYHHNNPTVLIPPWKIPEDQTVDIPYTYLFRHNAEIDSDSDTDYDNSDYLLDVYSSDQFRMYEFKVRRCTRERSYDWTDCPSYAHPGEKARRRDPRKYVYSGTPCPDYRKGNCKKSDACEYGHGVFECWLHPSRYRTQVCQDGLNCTRRVCFFAHTVEQLRVVSALSPRKSVETYDGSPLRKAVSSPVTSPVSDLVSTLRQLQLSKVFTTHHRMVRLYKPKPQKNRIREKTKKPKSKTTSTGNSKRSQTQKKNPRH